MLVSGMSGTTRVGVYASVVCVFLSNSHHHLHCVPILLRPIFFLGGVFCVSGHICWVHLLKGSYGMVVITISFGTKGKHSFLV